MLGSANLRGRNMNDNPQPIVKTTERGLGYHTLVMK
jgi:hypothetical protein